MELIEIYNWWSNKYPTYQINFFWFSCMAVVTTRMYIFSDFTYVRIGSSCVFSCGANLVQHKLILILKFSTWNNVDMNETEFELYLNRTAIKLIHTFTTWIERSIWKVMQKENCLLDENKNTPVCSTWTNTHLLNSCVHKIK